MRNPYKKMCEQAYFIGYEQLFFSRSFRRLIVSGQ